MAEEADDSGSGGAEPGYIYFYYVTATRDGEHPYIEASVHKRSSGSLEENIADLIHQAKAGDNHPSGWGMGDIRWRHRSHLVVVLNDGGCDLHGVIFSNPPRSGVQHKVTFTSRRLDTIGNLPVWICTNNLWDRNKNPLTRRISQRFGVALDVRSKNGVAPSLGHNDSGTNTGPP
ncbi:MAG TPA: hypothetical protein VGB62_04760 [Allosphingosinicella sp.]|jgi:hypothetical protein